MSISSSSPLRDILRLYYIERPGISVGAREQYGISLRAFERYLGGQATIADLTAENISGFLTAMLDAGRAPRTCNGKRATLLMLARFSVDSGWLEKLPRVRKMKEPKRDPRAFLFEQMERIIAACQLSPAMPRTLGAKSGKLRTWKPDDTLMFVLAIWESGNRPSALLHARFRDLSDDGFLRIDASFTKTRTDKIDMLSPELVAMINRRKQERNARPDDLIFDWPGHKRQLWRYYHVYVFEPAGVANEKLSLYGILKSATSHIARDEGDVAAMLFRGHTDAQMTRAHYIDPRIAHTKKAAATILPKLNIAPIIPPKDTTEGGDQ